MERYDTSIIAIAISRTMICKECPYPCTSKDHSNMYACELHWKKVLDLVKYKGATNNGRVQCD